jgi:two-component system NtrC family sensor kinase
MKYIFIISLMIVLGLQVVGGQTTIIDSLNKLLLRTGQDTNKVLLLVELAANYQFYNSDTALSLTDEALKLSRKLNFRKGETKAISRQGEVRHLRGELPQALEADLTAIQLGREYNYPDAEAESLTFISAVYSVLGEYRQALNYLFQAKKIYDNIASQLPTGDAQHFPVVVLSNIGDAYENLNMIDSALYFQKLALNYPIKKIYQLRSGILVRIGIIESRRKNYSSALSNFREVLRITDTSKEVLTRCWAEYQIAEIYNLQNNFDSGIYYAKSAYINAQKSLQKTSLLDASSLLTKLYKAKGDVDSAFYYQQRAMDAKDSLFGLDKFRKLQLLMLSEQQRVQQLKEEQALSKTRMQRMTLLFFIGVFLFTAIVLWRSNRQQKKANLILNQKNLQIKKQSESLKKTLYDLESTQAQLIQSEKMASLGQLTAGIAHEIQNPLNFINNFSEVCNELIGEMVDEVDKGNTKEVKAIAQDVQQNLEKVLHHGKRADSIVKGMLQHSRASTGKKELTDINALMDECIRLSFHGMRAKDKEFNAEIKTELDGSIGKANVVPQDISRILLNLLNNAFYAVDEKKKKAPALKGDEAYSPTVSVCTKKLDGKVEIYVRDNGNGIPQNIIDKIFQPFFTTKPTGQGTGLGLSLSYDIVKAHGGEIKVESEEGKGSEFIIQLHLANTLKEA